MGEADQRIASEVRPGDVLAGRFRIEREIGRGGMAHVYKAQDLATDRAVAVKLLKPDIAGNKEAVERLRREGEVLSSLKNPAIVAIETFGKLPDGRLFLAMEMLEGETLGARIRRGQMDPPEVTPIVTGAAAGLGAAHRKGVIHRDLKPDNIFLAIETTGQTQVKLLDFGISKVYDRERLTATGQILGTPRYMAPEQLSGDRDLDARVDVYAMGVILYEALAGQPPFPSASPSDLIIAILHGKAAPLSANRPGLPPGLEAIVMRAMARVREARYGSLTELAEAWLDVAMPPSPAKPARGGMRTNVLGAMGSVRGDDAEEPEGSVLRPGTFSAFVGRKPGMRTMPQGTVGGVPAGADAAAGDVTARARPGAKDRAASPPRTAESTRAPALARAPAAIAIPAAAPLPGAPLPGAPLPAHGASPLAAASPAPTPATEPASGPAVYGSGASGAYPQDSIHLPTNKSGRLWLIAGALLAGGISAALAIGALQFFADDVPEPPPPAPTAVELSPRGAATPAPSPTPPVVAPPVVGLPAVDAPAPELPNGAATPEPEQPESGRRRRRARPVDTASPAFVGPAAEESASEDTPRALLRRAREAQRRGDPRACLTLAARAMERGGSSAALRLQGDCYIAAGDRREGLKAYERFCRLFPDHPAIGEVRGVVDAMGGSCL